MSEDEPPRRVSDTVYLVQLTGCLLPWRHWGQPATIGIVGGGNQLYVPVFTTVEKLRALMETYTVRYESIKQVDEGREFALSVFESGLGIVLDPHRKENGMIGYLNVWLKGEGQA